MTTPSLQHQAMWLLEKRVALLGLRQKRHRVHRSTNLKGIVNFFGCDTGRVNILWVQKAAWPESRRPKDYGRDGRQIWVICAILTSYHQFDKAFERVPFEFLGRNVGERIYCPVSYGSAKMELTGEQITAALFTKLKNIAEDTLGTQVFYDQYIGQNAFLS